MFEEFKQKNKSLKWLKIIKGKLLGVFFEYSVAKHLFETEWNNSIKTWKRLVCPGRAEARSRFARMAPKWYAMMERDAQAFFCQLLRITLLGRIRSVQFNFTDFLGTLELLRLPLGVFYNPGFREEGARLRWPSAAGPARGRSGGGAGRPISPQGPGTAWGVRPKPLRIKDEGSQASGLCACVFHSKQTEYDKRLVNWSKWSFESSHNDSGSRLLKVRACCLLKCCHKKPSKGYILLQRPSVRIRRLLL